MIEYKTQKKERYYSEVIRLYTELGYSIGHISRIFPLSYGIVKRWLSIFAEEERKDNESAMKKKSSTTQNHMDSVLFRLFQFVSVIAFDLLSVLISFEFRLNLVSLPFS